MDPDNQETQQPYSYGFDDPVIVSDPTGDFGTLQSCPSGVQTEPKDNEWSCVGAIFPTAGKEVLIRRGTYDKKTTAGWGYLKFTGKHKVMSQTVANVVATIPPEEIKKEGTSDVYQTCQDSNGALLPDGICVRVIVIATDRYGSQVTPDHHEVGVQTAYCLFGQPNYTGKEPNDDCPGWVNSASGP